ncbi:MAG: hypothetical protein JO332_06625 [Planctomycetaceae bacterium]|nr:hypothetical protein [Planctomycetaceae bacterium]
MSQLASRPVRRYSLEPQACYSLREAARLADIPVDRLRRAVVLGDVPAEPVDDDRDYLLRGQAIRDYVQSIRPGERAELHGGDDIDWGIGIFLAFPLLALFVFGIGLNCPPPPETGPDGTGERIEIRQEAPERIGSSGPWSWFPDMLRNSAAIRRSAGAPR